MTSASSVSPSGGSRGVVMVDVARLAGVSQKTVSRVVNGAPHVRPDVRERVNRAIERLGYRPNRAAQALARERSHAIGVLALGTRFFGPSRRVFTLEHEARRLGYTMALTSVPDLSARSVADGHRRVAKAGSRGSGGGGADASHRYRPRPTCRIARSDKRRLDHWCFASSRCRHRPGGGLSRADHVPPQPRTRDGLARWWAARLGCGPETSRWLAIGSARRRCPRAARALRGLVSRIGLRTGSQARIP